MEARSVGMARPSGAPWFTGWGLEEAGLMSQQTGGRNPKQEGMKALVKQKRENLREGLDQETDGDRINETQAEGAWCAGAGGCEVCAVRI